MYLYWFEKRSRWSFVFVPTKFILRHNNLHITWFPSFQELKASSWCQIQITETKWTLHENIFTNSSLSKAEHILSTYFAKLKADKDIYHRRQFRKVEWRLPSNKGLVTGVPDKLWQTEPGSSVWYFTCTYCRMMILVKK